MSPSFPNSPDAAAASQEPVVLSLLVAADEQNVIGRDNQLPWHLPGDLKYFKNLTWGMPVLMGRKTFESIGRPLAGRKFIVITRNPDWRREGVQVVHSVEEAIGAARRYGVREVFVIGGAEIFRTALEQADRIYLTRIHHRFEGDAYFPQLDPAQWRQVQSRRVEADPKNAYAHSFEVWERASRVH